MKKATVQMNKKAELQIAPLIDVVFLLLIYFVMTTTLKSEADLSFLLPTPPDKDVVINMPVEMLIEINAAGDISYNGIIFGENGLLDDLVNELKGQQQMAKNEKSIFIVNILPDDKALHGRIIAVMNACAEAEVKNLSFSSSM
jgi:biopolymer transport protein ExbD